MKAKRVTQLSGATTPARDNASLVLHEGKLYLYGGDDAGRPTASLFSLNIHSDVAAWQAVKQAGDVPAARPCPNCFIWGEQLWLYDGCPDEAPSSAGGGLADLHRFEFLTHSWAAIEQNGCVPDRRLHSTAYRGFGRTVTYGPYLLAFGCEQGDENASPPADTSQNGASSAAAPGLQQKQLLLHAYDFCSNTWSWVPTAGGPAFTHCCALVLVDHLLIAVGHSLDRKGLAGQLQVNVLDLQNHGQGLLSWSDVTAAGSSPQSPADTGSSSYAVCDDFLVICGPTARGAPGAAGTGPARLLALDLRSWSWLEVDVPPAGAVKPGQGHVQKSRKLGHHLQASGHSLAWSSADQALYITGRATSAAGTHITQVLSLQLAPSPVKLEAPRKAEPKLPLVQQCRIDPSADLRPFCCNELMSDVILSVGGSLFFAHRVVLAASSPRLRAVLQAAAAMPPEVGRRHKIDIFDVQPHIMEVLLKYIYGCLEAVPAKDAMLLFSASDRYGLAQLREACYSALFQDLTAETVTGYIMLAEEHQHAALKEACIEFAGKSLSLLHQVLSTRGYLQLTVANAGLGQSFALAAMQRVMEGAAAQQANGASPVTPF